MRGVRQPMYEIGPDDWAEPVSPKPHEPLRRSGYVLIWMCIFTAGIYALDWLADEGGTRNCILTHKPNLCPISVLGLAPQSGEIAQEFGLLGTTNRTSAQFLPELHLSKVLAYLSKASGASITSRHPIRPLPDRLPYDRMKVFDDD